MRKAVMRVKQDASYLRSMLAAMLALVLAVGLMLPATALASPTQEQGNSASGYTAGEVDFDAEVDEEGSFPASLLAAFASAIDTLSVSEQVVGPFTISGGEMASSATAEGDYYYDAAAKVLHVKGSAPLTIANTNPAVATDSTIQIDAGVKADVTFAGVNIRAAKTPLNIVTNKMGTASGSAATKGSDILPENRTMLFLTLADGQTNTLYSTYDYAAGIRCGEGSILVIDDSVANVKSGGSKFNLDDIITPEKGKVPYDATLLNGKSIQKGDSLADMEGANPGKLNVTSGLNAAGIGGAPQEYSGYLVFNGGDVTAVSTSSSQGGGAGIGGGAGGGATTSVFNGGILHATGSYHAAGVGCGRYYNPSPNTGVPSDAIATSFTNGGNVDGKNAPNCGDIYLNGGLLFSEGTGHGGGFGVGCCGNAKGSTIMITGGTVICDGKGGVYSDIVARRDNNNTMVKDNNDPYGGHVVITGGSVFPKYNRFDGIGDTAWANQAYLEEGYNPSNANDPNKVYMVTIDLTAQIKANNAQSGITTDSALDDRILKWDLEIDGIPVDDYGSPYSFYNGKIYLWLPKSSADKEIGVTLTYRDKNGDEQQIAPLYRQPGTSQGGNTLKSYEMIDIPQGDGATWKYYDGTPLASISLETYRDESGQPLKDKNGNPLNSMTGVTVNCVRYDSIGGTPLSDSALNDMALLPADAGVSKVIIDSPQYAAADPNGFGLSNWGHRVTAWCEIKPTVSTVDLAGAEWKYLGNGAGVIQVAATIAAGDTTPEGDAFDNSSCAAPQGYVQLYVDGKAVGDKVKLTFDGDGKNATAAGNATILSHEFPILATDFEKPASGYTHMVSLHYLPPSDGDAEPANYLASVNPVEDPDGAPQEPIEVRPVDPEPDVSLEDPDGPKDPNDPNDPTDPDDPDNPNNPDDPDNPNDPDDPNGPGSDPDAPKPPKPTINIPGSSTPDPDDPDWKVQVGSIDTYYGDPTPEDPYPGRVTMNITTASPGAIKIAGYDDKLIDAEFVRGDDGEPLKNDDGTYTLVIDPKKLGSGKIYIEQEPHGIFSGTRWAIDVNVLQDPTKPPVIPPADDPGDDILIPGGDDPIPGDGNGTGGVGTSGTGGNGGSGGNGGTSIGDNPNPLGSGSGAAQSSGGIHLPQTGDPILMWAMISLVMLAGISFGVALIARRRAKVFE